MEIPNLVGPGGFNFKESLDAIPHGESLDLDEYPIHLLELRKCRSFRADLSHKLHLIMQSFGGWGYGGLRQTAFRLGVCRMTLNNWLNWRTVPGDRVMLETIDNAYEQAVERLALEASRKVNERKAS